MKLKLDESLSNFVFKFKLRRYSSEDKMEEYIKMIADSGAKAGCLQGPSPSTLRRDQIATPSTFSQMIDLRGSSTQAGRVNGWSAWSATPRIRYSTTQTSSFLKWRGLGRVGCQLTRVESAKFLRSREWGERLTWSWWRRGL